MTILFLIIGLGCLVIGAEMLVRGASRLAAAIGISPLVIGLTVVAFGTSSPELAVSVKSAFSDQAGIAVGNVVGSNIFNVLFILGISAVIAPLIVAQQLIRIDVPIMIAVSIIMWLFAYDGIFSRFEGVVLVITLFLYTAMLIRISRHEKVEIQQEYAKEFGNVDKKNNAWWFNSVLVIGGLLLLVLGSNWLVDSAVKIAQFFGVSELVIGLTIVAAGTSMPEVVTSIIASLRGERDIAVGNVVGSNLFNIMGVLGITSIVAPHGVEVSPAAIRFDIPIMIVVAFACLPIFFTGGRISRWEGALLLGYYLVYTLFLVMSATHSEALPGLGKALLYFAIPLTILTLLVMAFQEWRRQRKS